ncbi:MAG: metallophosphoesterase [Pseudomonadales bacterium]
MSSDSTSLQTSGRVGALKTLYRRTMPVLLFALVYFGMLVYPVLRMTTLALPDWQPGTPVLLIIMVGPLAARLGYEWWPCTATRGLSALALTWLGVCFLSFSLVLPWELFNLFLPLDGPGTGIISGWLLLGAAGLISLYALVNAQRLHVRRIEIPAPGRLAGTRLVQISDVHVGSRSGRFLSRVVRRVNALAPDHVLITGDLIDFRDIQTDEIAALATLTAPAYFAIGNHERYVDLDEICERLEQLGVQVLRNDSRDLGTLQIVGIDDADARTQVGRILPLLEPLPDRFRILLYHRPDGATDAAEWGTDLMLCGHTHNGQIMPFNYLVRRVFPRICGLYAVAQMQLYVSPGTGTWGPVMRFGSRCEISVLELVDRAQEHPG